jgi:hypothetical protein
MDGIGQRPHRLAHHVVVMQCAFFVALTLDVQGRSKPLRLQHQVGGLVRDRTRHL